MTDTGSYLPTYEGCLICGQPKLNPNTMNLRFRATAGGVETTCTPGPRQEGFKGIVHGGVLCSLLDETIGWAVAVDRKRYFMTAELNVRFIRPLQTATAVVVKGRAVEHKFRYSVAEGEIIGTDGTVYARATGKFFLMSDEESRQVHGYLTFQEGDLDFA